KLHSHGYFKVFNFSAHSSGPHALSVSSTSLSSMTFFGAPVREEEKNNV
ncbi:MAG: hypothetical protein ACI8RD_014832, partial [Bacillariaceae sp.]